MVAKRRRSGKGNASYLRGFPAAPRHALLPLCVWRRFWLRVLNKACAMAYCHVRIFRQTTLDELKRTASELAVGYRSRFVGSVLAAGLFQYVSLIVTVRLQCGYTC